MKNLMKVLLIGIITVSVCVLIVPKSAKAFIGFPGPGFPGPGSFSLPSKWGSDQNKIFDDVMGNLDDAKDKALSEYNNKLNDLITKFISNYNNENFDPKEILKQLKEIRENYQSKLDKIDNKQSFLEEIKGMTQKELKDKRNAIMSKNDDKFNIIKGYMDAENKDKFMAEKIKEFNNERKKARKEMSDAIDNLCENFEGDTLTSEFLHKLSNIRKEYDNKISEIEEKENFLYEVKAMTPKELQKKLDNCKYKISDSKGNGISQWKLDTLSKFIPKKSSKHGDHVGVVVSDEGDYSWRSNPDINGAGSVGIRSGR